MATENEKQSRAERSLYRRQRMVGNRARSFEEAEAWDLAFWQQAGADARLSALVAIHRDVAAVNKGVPEDSGGIRLVKRSKEETDG